MKVYVPFVGSPRLEVMSALSAAGVAATYWPCDADEEAYYRLLVKLWSEGESFTIIEHDIVVKPGVIEEMWACPELHCGFPYPVMGLVDAFLGCTTFKAELMAAHPDLLERVGRIDNDGMPARHWSHNDYRIGTLLAEAGYRLHRHWPPLEHLNPQYRQTHRCVYGAECSCGFAPNHGCPFAFPGRTNMTSAVFIHWCKQDELPSHLDCYDMQGNLIRQHDEPDPPELTAPRDASLGKKIELGTEAA